MNRDRRSSGSTRLVVALSAAVAAGVAAYAVWSARGDEPLRPREPLSVVDPAPAPAEIPDLGPVKALRASGGDPRAFHRPALEHVLGVVASGTLPRRAGLVLPLEKAAALDVAAAAGQLVETAGVVKSLDREKFESAANARWDQLWSFALAADDGTQVVVIDPGASATPDGGAPANARVEGAAVQPLKSGDRVRVRGVFLQRRTGALGAMNLQAPTVVLVGREYRVTGPVSAAPARLEDIPFATVKDSSWGETLDVADDVHWGLLAWARARGPVPIANDLLSGGLAVRPWARTEFLRWKRELESDKGQGEQSGTDPRTWTVAQRGKVFALTGNLADAVGEDWESVPANPYDVDRRTVVWIVSDHLANMPIPFYSAFALAQFPAVPAPTSGEKGHARVRVFGMYVRNFSYRSKVGSDVTVPSYQMLYIERM